jgi:hypothetical protein
MIAHTHSENKRIWTMGPTDTAYSHCSTSHDIRIEWTPKAEKEGVTMYTSAALIFVCSLFTTADVNLLQQS